MNEFTNQPEKLLLARQWIKRGLGSIFLCAPGAKSPLQGTNGLLDATQDMRVLAAWLAAEPDANLALRPNARVVVVDLDCHPGGADGFASWAQAGGEIDKTLAVGTAGGGKHLYFRTATPLRQSAGLLPGVDVRTARGYVLIPPSMVNGRRYELATDCEPAPVPEWLAELIGPAAAERTPTAILRNIPDDQPQNVARFREYAEGFPAARPGTWHSSDVILAAEARRCAVSPEAALDVLREVWVPRGTGFFDGGRNERWQADFEETYRWATANSGAEHGIHALPGTPAEVFGNVNLIPASPDHAVLEAASVARQNTLADLSTTGRRQDVAPTQDNAARILRGDPLLRGLVALDEFSGRLLIGRSPPALRDMESAAPGPYPRELRDSDETRILAYLHQSWGADFGGAMLTAALRVEAEDNRFHPVRRWLETLAWDGVPRLDSWLCRVFGAADTAYTRAVAAKMLIAAVRRVRAPGCKFDYLPVLAGGQGIGKSSALAVLFGRNWFTDHLHDDLSSREAAMGLAGVWAVELSEITQLVRSRAETAKAFLSRPVDRYRVPYARNAVDVPRQCILIGTTNADSFLVDATGNRRYWPIQCGAAPADLTWLGANRTQLWAEAVRREAGGESVWLDDAGIRQAAEAAQDAVYESDPWQDRIAARLGTQPVRLPELMTQALSLPAAQQGKPEQGRVAAILRRLGWVRRNGWDRAAGKAAWMWHPPEGWQATRRGAAFDPFAEGASPPGAGGGEVGGEAVTP